MNFLSFLVRAGAEEGVLAYFFASVFDGRMREWLVFQFGMSVFENGKRLLDISWHEQMDLVVGVIPMQVNSNVAST